MEAGRQERVRAKEMFLKALVIHQLVTGKPGCVRNSKWRSQLHTGGVAHEQCVCQLLWKIYFRYHKLPERIRGEEKKKHDT